MPSNALHKDDREMLRHVFRAARKAGWTRDHGTPVDSTVAYCWSNDTSSVVLERWLGTPEGQLTMLDINGVVRADLVCLEFAIDLLAASGVLPAELSSQYAAGYGDGAWHITDEAVNRELDDRWDKVLTSVDHKDSPLWQAIGRMVDESLPGAHRWDRRERIAAIVGEVQAVLHAA